MKRVLSLVLALSMVMSMFTFSFAGTSLKDVAGTEYESAVEALVELGIVNGYKDGTYLPENVVSRSEMAKLLVVAAGLAPAAELAEGTTKFSDVAADHWATGYINVAAEYGYVMGDPDGSFRPDDTVSYAEAITMALRVLGYKTVVEAKGTWPTNYIAKAEELDLLEDITYGTYAAGAARGNVALLIWNMLRLPMWDVWSESEGDGLTYTETELSMLNIKFKDYRYEVTDFKKAFINGDGEVMVDLAILDSSIEYAKNDFYTFVPGSEVEVLINKKDKMLLTMVETDEYKYVAGGKVELDEAYDESTENDILNEVYSYAYALVDGKKIDRATLLDVASTYIYELDDSSSKKLKYNGIKGDSLKYDDYDDKRIILKDGELASVKDLEVGDVWSVIDVYYTKTNDTVGNTPDFTFYMISGAEAEGKLTKLVKQDFDAPTDATYYEATIGNEVYPVATDAVYFVDAEDVEDNEEETLLAYESDAWVLPSEPTLKDMKNEEVTFVTDFLGRVVAVLFDGELNGGDANAKNNTVAFYALVSNVERDGSTYSITVANEDGEETLTFAKNAGNDYWKNDTDLAGQYALVKLNDDGEITALYKDLEDETLDALKAAKEPTVDTTRHTVVYDLEDEADLADDKTYTVVGFESLTFDNNKLLADDDSEKAKVNDDTVVVTLVYDDNDTERDTDDDEYTVTFSGIEAIENMKKDPAVIITDEGSSNFARAKYVVIFDEVSAREDDLVGIVKEAVINELGDKVLTIVEDRDDDAEDGSEYILAEGENVSDKPQVIVYSIEENDNGDWELKISARLTANELKGSYPQHLSIAENKDKANVSEDGREAVVKAEELAMLGLTGTTFDLDDEKVSDIFEDAKIVLVNVVLDADEDSTETQYFVDNYEVVEYADVELKELDRISFTGETVKDGVITEVETVFIIRGMKAVADFQ